MGAVPKAGYIIGKYRLLRQDTIRLYGFCFYVLSYCCNDQTEFFITLISFEILIDGQMIHKRFIIGFFIVLNRISFVIIYSLSGIR